MELQLWQTLLIVCPLVFLAGFIDSAAGGGGLISLPAYLAAGLPPHLAVGTNKFSSCIGTTISTIRFWRSGAIHLKVALLAAGGSLVGALIGSRLLLFVPDDWVKVIILVLLPFAAAFVLLHRSFGEAPSAQALQRQNSLLLAVGIGLAIGTYDGFFGPGTGTFLIFAFTGLMGFDLRTASGNAKIANLASNVASVLVFLPAGQVLLPVALPAALCSIAGHYLGSGLAIKKGAKAIRVLLIVVMVLLFCTVAKDVAEAFLAR